MLETIGLEALITWAGTAGIIFGSGKVLLNGTKQAIIETRQDVRDIKVGQMANTVKIGVLDERTIHLSEMVSRLESIIE